MAYSLSDKITRYLESKGVKGASVREGIIVMPTENGGEMHRKITGARKEKSDGLKAMAEMSAEELGLVEVPPLAAPEEQDGSLERAIKAWRMPE